MTRSRHLAGTPRHSSSTSLTEEVGRPSAVARLLQRSANGLRSCRTSEKSSLPAVGTSLHVMERMGDRYEGKRKLLQTCSKIL